MTSSLCYFWCLPFPSPSFHPLTDKSRGQRRTQRLYPDGYVEKLYPSAESGQRGRELCCFIWIHPLSAVVVITLFLRIRISHDETALLKPLCLLCFLKEAVAKSPVGCRQVTLSKIHPPLFWKSVKRGRSLTQLLSKQLDFWYVWECPDWCYHIFP